jgi:hypothetical protein
MGAIFRYRKHLTETVAVRSLEAALRYHVLLVRAVDSGRHNFFTEDGHYHSASMSIVRDFCEQNKSSNNGGLSRTRTKTGSGRAATKKPVYPAGSCTHHPQSTTHTTAQCNKGASTSTTTASIAASAARPAQ